MIKGIVIVTLILFKISSVFSQDCLEKVAKQAVEIDSLQKIIVDANNQFNNLMTKGRSSQKALSDTIKLLKAELLSLEKYKSQKKGFDAKLSSKIDSIALLKMQLLDKVNQIAIIEQLGEQKALTEKERGKTETLTKIINSYKKSFDELIKSSNKESVERDIQYIINDKELKPVLDDLKIYFNAIELLSFKFDLANVKIAQTQLNQIKRNSILFDNLKETIDNYQTFNDGLIETLNKIDNFDKLEKVGEMGDEIQKKKFNKILSVLSSYIFNYDFNLKDYPYLAEIVLEVLKRKQPNPDADITDLMIKL